ncbi:hypothetical protein A9Q87_04235 [Flavobacteriales bacterium 34_180_T64]|nr:hypothetical protein A9Q87_04235 [Flavobacteriales bacterium 34_180_T64]
MILVIAINSYLPLLIIVIIGIVGFCVYYFNPKQVILRTLSKIPNRSIGSLRSNKLTKITGKALHVKAALIAPLSKRKCVFYTMKIEKKVSTGKSSHWKTIIKEEKVQDFFIDKDGEYVIIKPVQNPKNFISYLVTDQTASSGTFNEPTPEFESLLNRYNIDSSGFFGFNKQLRYTEGIIEIGETITVSGIAKWKQLSEPIPEYTYSKIAALDSTDKQKLIITDLPMANVSRHK